MALLLPLLLALPPSAGTAIGIGLGFAVILTSLTYMLAYFFQSPPLQAVAKEELAALIFSVLIVAFWLGMDGVLSGATVGLIASSDPALGALAAQSGGTNIITGHVSLAIGSMELLFTKLKGMYTSLYLFEALIGFLSTISFPLGSPMMGVNLISFSLMPFDGLALLSNAHTVIVEAIGYMMVMVWAKQFILIFARDCVPILLLPFGLVLRAFPFFRSTGSSVIAICVAVYFVLPLAVLFSNYLIFDVYQPSDYVWSPVSASVMSSSDPEGRANTMVTGSKAKAKELMDLFSAQPLTQQASTQGDCGGSFLSRIWCGGKNIVKGSWEAAKSFAKTMGTIWWFMMGLTGDFFQNFFSATNPVMPAAATAGLYEFIVDEVITVSQFVVLVIFTSVLEIILTITMYRNIAMLIGGEIEIAGLTKLV